MPTQKSGFTQTQLGNGPGLSQRMQNMMVTRSTIANAPAFVDATGAQKWLVDNRLITSSTKFNLRDGSNISVILGLAREVVMAIRAVEALVMELGDEAAKEREEIIKAEVTERLTDMFANALMETMVGVKNELSHELKEGDSSERMPRDAYRQAVISGRNAQQGGTRMGVIQEQRMKARLGVKDRQLRVVPEKEQIPEIMNKANMRLIEEFNEVLKKMDAGTEHVVVAVGKIWGGTELLVEFESVEGAKWVHEQSAAFYKHMEHLVICPQTYKIIVMNAPLTFHAESTEEWTAALADSQGDYKPGCIVHAQWIKAEHNQQEQQTRGHALLSVNSLQMANSIITQGIVVGHRAKDKEQCARGDEMEDLCGTCGGAHRASACNDHQTRANCRCVNCKVDGHASWDLNCPYKKRKQHEHNQRVPENAMPYFPTHGEEWTWAMEASHEVFAGPTLESVTIQFGRLSQRERRK
ncbi:hypothetical protein ARMGADRAFT_1028520 [Armillaria gallica]|uniref:Uncharacterized protein n=1 Tax=Armillaria gallica TaxID=47427 RepID=A0A2H3E614_ARMGA|nr:hypothetical protein ARMGADRAFT_1028520 [Armillaria gallica]